MTIKEFKTKSRGDKYSYLTKSTIEVKRRSRGRPQDNTVQFNVDDDQIKRWDGSRVGKLHVKRTTWNIDRGSSRRENHDAPPPPVEPDLESSEKLFEDNLFELCKNPDMVNCTVLNGREMSLTKGSELQAIFIRFDSPPPFTGNPFLIE